MAPAKAATETPPRAWGRRGVVRFDVIHGGNTPTSVGKTRASPSCGRGGRKHPHERGEDDKAVQLRIKGKETPPRAWGRLPGLLQLFEPSGNTPTSVGKTGNHAARSGYGQKHPHERGEDRNIAQCTEVDMETPPRAWGRPRRSHERGMPCRNTPTSVGKTASDPALPARTRKHPHERGEDMVWMPCPFPGTETPPRAWGRLRKQLAHLIHS